MVQRINEDKRIKSRKRKSLFRKFLAVSWILLSVAIFFGVIFGLNYFYNSSYFKIKYVRLKNNKSYDTQDITSYLKDIIGKNIFEVNKKSIEDLLVNNFPKIKSAKLEKIFPDTIVISIVEREQYLIINHKSNFFLIDNEWVVIDNITKNKDDYKNLIVVEDCLNHQPEIGENIGVKNVLSIGEIYNSFNDFVKSKIKSAGIEIDKFGDIFFRTIDDKLIIYGSKSEMIKKNLILEEIFKEIENEEISYSIIDIRITDNPIIK